MSDQLNQENLLPLVRENEDAIKAGEEAPNDIPTNVLGKLFAAAIKARDGATEVLVSMIPTKFIPVAMKGRNNEKKAAPAVILATFVGDKATLPVQVSGYSGGIQLDLVQTTGVLQQLCRWGFSASVGKFDAPEYFNGCTASFADLAFEVAGAAFDSEEGLNFRASLLEPEVVDEAAAGRAERRGFKRILAVNSDHHATARRSSSAATYLEVAAVRAQERLQKQATRNVTSALPF